VSKIIIAPQPGPQTSFLSSRAQIVIYGGAAGGGKTYGLLLDPLRHYNNPKFKGIIFRRLTKEITMQGGLMDTARELYESLRPKFRESAQYLDCKLTTGWHLAFAHLQLEKTVEQYQGLQAAYVGWDELTHFTKKQFTYPITRARTMADILTRYRGTCNPDPDHWIKETIRWWLDEEGRFADPKKSGVVRWFVIDQLTDQWEWYDSREEIAAKYSEKFARTAKSFTFIPSKLSDNQIMLDKNPDYEANLSMQDRVTRLRLLEGDWLIKAAPGIFFKRADFREVDQYPALESITRFYDRAATKYIPGKNNPDYTCSVRMGRTEDGEYVITGLSSARVSAANVERQIKNTAKQDTNRVRVCTFQDPGGAGKNEAERFIKMMAGYDCGITLATNKKEVNAKSFSAQVEFGNVMIWTGIPIAERRLFYMMLEGFPCENSSVPDDYVDAASGAFNDLADTAQVWAF